MITIEMGQLKLQIENNCVKVEGSINEDLQIDKLSILQSSPHLVIDLNSVKMINSCGIREWIRLIESLGTGVQLEYVNVPQMVVQQMNMISGFLSKNAKVTSFYAPYFIEDLDQERQILLKSADIQNFKAPTLSEKIDGEEYKLDFDAIEEQYFRFLKRS